MDRREFMRLAGTGATLGTAAEALATAKTPPPLTPAAATASTPQTARRAVMKVGTQHGDSDQILRAMAGFGVTHICSRLPSAKLDDTWSVDGLSRMRERVESF